MPYPAGSGSGCEDMDEVGHDSGRAGAVGDVGDLMVDTHRTGVVQQTVVANRGQAFQHGDHVIDGHVL